MSPWHLGVVLMLTTAGAAASGGHPLVGDSAVPAGLADWERIRQQVRNGQIALDETGLPTGLDTASSKRSRGDTFGVAIRPDTAGGNGPPLNSIHDWLLTLTTGEGEPVEGATVRIFGGMPLHDHGFPTEPSVTELDGGRYRLRGLKFHMPGWWQLIFLVTSEGETDVVTFEVPVTAPRHRSRPEWTEHDLALLRSLSIDRLGAVPPDPSNRVADDPRAAELGRDLFFETRLSANGRVACATCHDPDSYFTTEDRFARGISRTRRHAPSLIGSAYGDWFYWDGRRDSAWAQALVPIEAPDEMGGSRSAAVRLVSDDPQLRSAYVSSFGALPDAGDRAAIDEAFANLGKALAAFERRLTPRPSRFDRYVRALESDGSAMDSVLDEDELAGLELFIDDRIGCIRCHGGPLLTNGGFHNIGLVSLESRPLDTGRQAGVIEVLSDPYNCLGSFSDADPPQCAELRHVRRAGPELPGAFKVPSLRNVGATAPYMHDGRFSTLEEVLAHYTQAPQGRLGHQELTPIELSRKQKRQLVAFLKTLTGE